MRLRDQGVVVTGGTRGIGRAIAGACLREGAKVAVTGRTKADVAGAHVVLADMTRDEDVERAAREIVAKLGRVDVLVNNAGNAESAPFAKTDRALWERMMAVNATSAFLVTRAFIGELAARGGRIVMVASIAGKTSAPYIAAYAASKHAMLGLMRSLAAEYGDKGVRVNAVCPGYVDTPLTERSVQNIVARTGRDPVEVRGALARMNPQKRFIQPGEVAELVVGLAAPDCMRNGEAIDL